MYLTKENFINNFVEFIKWLDDRKMFSGSDWVKKEKIMEYPDLYKGYLNSFSHFTHDKNVIVLHNNDPVNINGIIITEDKNGEQTNYDYKYSYEVNKSESYNDFLKNMFKEDYNFMAYSLSTEKLNSWRYKYRTMRTGDIFMPVFSFSLIIPENKNIYEIWQEFTDYLERNK